MNGIPERPLISIVTPCWNEEECLEPYFQQVNDAISDSEADVDLEFLLVDDGSTDRTPEIMRQIADRDPRVRILRMSRNFGSYPSISAGLYHARGDAAICISADLQDPPTLIPRMIDLWRKGSDVVWAVREGRDDPWAKTLFANAFYGLMRLTSFPDLPRGGMDVGLFSRRVIDVYRAIPERDNIPFLTIFKLGFPHSQIPYRRQARLAGTGGWPFWRRVRTALDVITSFSYTPVRLISATGLLAATVGLLYAVGIVITWLIYDIFAPGWSSVMVVLLIVSGLQLVSLGFISEYLWRQNRQVRNEPRYIVIEDYGGPNLPERDNPVTDPNNINVAHPGPVVTGRNEQARSVD